MNELEMFNNDNFGEVRVVPEDDEVWFVAKDVADILEYSRTHDATRRLDDDEKGTELLRTPGGSQEMKVVNEFGLYNLVLGSQKEEAKEFKRWITHEVLPDIRKHGMYATESTAEQMLDDPDAAIEILENYKKEKEENQELKKDRKIQQKGDKSEVKSSNNEENEGITLDEFTGWVNRKLEEHELTKKQIIKALTGQGKYFKKTAFGQPYKKYRGDRFYYMEPEQKFPIIKGKYDREFLNTLARSAGNQYDPQNDYYDAVMELYDVLTA